MRDVSGARGIRPPTARLSISYTRLDVTQWDVIRNIREGKPSKTKAIQSDIHLEKISVAQEGTTVFLLKKKKNYLA